MAFSVRLTKSFVALLTLAWKKGRFDERRASRSSRTRHLLARPLVRGKVGLTRESPTASPADLQTSGR
jgi:hypothetical protein